jgi:hypothetical protein
MAIHNTRGAILVVLACCCIALLLPSSGVSAVGLHKHEHWHEHGHPDDEEEGEMVRTGTTEEEEEEGGSSQQRVIYSPTDPEWFLLQATRFTRSTATNARSWVTHEAPKLAHAAHSLCMQRLNEGVSWTAVVAVVTLAVVVLASSYIRYRVETRYKQL